MTATTHPVLAFDADGRAFEYAPTTDATDPGVTITVTDNADYGCSFDLYGEGLLEFVAVALRQYARGLQAQPCGEVLSALRCIAPLLDKPDEVF